MEEYTAAEVARLIEEETQSSLEALLRAGARRMLQAALERDTDYSTPTLSRRVYIVQCIERRICLVGRL